MDQHADNLGELRHTFRPKVANIFAGAMIGLIFLVGGISFASYIALKKERKTLDTRNRVAKYAGMGFVGIAGPLAGIAMLVWMKRLSSHRVYVYDDGFSYTYHNSTDICRWTEVKKIDEVFTEQQLKVLKLPGASIKTIDRSFAVCRKDGAEFRFSVDSVDSIPRLAECLQEASEKHSIPWEQVEQ